jgi:hypothetical protein
MKKQELSIQELIDTAHTLINQSVFFDTAEKIKRDGFRFIGLDEEGFNCYQRQEHEIIRLKVQRIRGLVLP